MNVVWSPPLLSSPLQSKVPLPPTSRSFLPSFASFAHGPTNDRASQLACFPLPRSFLLRSFLLFTSSVDLDRYCFRPSTPAAPVPDPALLCGPFLPRKTTSLVRFEDFFVSALLSKAPALRLREVTRRREIPPSEKWFFLFANGRTTDRGRELAFQWQSLSRSPPVFRPPKYENEGKTVSWHASSVLRPHSILPSVHRYFRWFAVGDI